MKLQLLIRQILRKVQNSLLGSYRHRFTHLSRFDRRNCEKTVDRISLRRQLHFDAISRCFCSTFYMILCKRSRLCDKVYSLQSQIKRDFSDALSMPRNETIKISLKMTIFRRRQKSPFRFPLRSGNRLKNDEMTAPSKSGLSKDMDEFLSLLISARSMSCPFF